MTYPGLTTYPTGSLYPGSFVRAPETPISVTSPFIPPVTLPTTWQLDNMTFGAPDAQGCWWIVRTSNGWHGPAKPRTQRVAKTFGPGSFRTPSFRGERIIVLTGSTKCPDGATRLDAMERLAAMAADPAQIYTLTVTDVATGVGRCMDVELDDRTDLKLVGTRWFDWSLQLAAPDPRKYSPTWQDPVSVLPTSSTGGLDFGSPGLDFTGGGLDFGLPGTNTMAQVANYGTAPTSPVFSVLGPAINPVIVDMSTGDRVQYLANLGASETLTINNGDFSALGLPPHSCLINRTTNVRTRVTIGPDWPQLDPQAVTSYQLFASSASTATLTVYLRSAYY